MNLTCSFGSVSMHCNLTLYPINRRFLNLKSGWGAGACGPKYFEPEDQPQQHSETKNQKEYCNCTSGEQRELSNLRISMSICYTCGR